MIGFGLILLLDEIFTRDLYYWSASKGWKPYNWLQPMLASAEANIKGKASETVADSSFLRDLFWLNVINRFVGVSYVGVRGYGPS